MILIDKTYDLDQILMNTYKKNIRILVSVVLPVALL